MYAEHNEQLECRLDVGGQAADRTLKDRIRSGRASLLDILIVLMSVAMVACIVALYLHRRARAGERRLEFYPFPKGITLDTPIVEYCCNETNPGRPTVRDRLRELGAIVNDHGELVDRGGRPIAFLRKSYPGVPMGPKFARELENKYGRAISELEKTHTVVVLIYKHI